MSFKYQKELEEERRLFYVAFNQSRTSLHLTHAQSRYR
jgi:superfamily I DNA/RNA helicase